MDFYYKDPRKNKRQIRKSKQFNARVVKFSDCCPDELPKFIKHYMGTKVMKHMSKDAFKQLVCLNADFSYKEIPLQKFHTLALIKKDLLHNIKDGLI